MSRSTKKNRAVGAFLSFLFGLTSSTVSGVFCRLVESGRISIDVRFEGDFKANGSGSGRSARSTRCRRTPSARRRIRRTV